jgi:hypothetical protein
MNEEYTNEAIRQRVKQTVDDYIEGKIDIDYNQQVLDTEENKYYPKWKNDNGLIYFLDEVTFIYFPLLTVEEQEPYQMGFYGKAREKYLKEEKPWEYSNLIMGGLWKHLVETDKTAYEMEERLMKQMMQAEGVTEELKRTQQMEWVGLVNNIKHSVREIILNEMIYV